MDPSEGMTVFESVGKGLLAFGIESEGGRVMLAI